MIADSGISLDLGPDHTPLIFRWLGRSSRNSSRVLESSCSNDCDPADSVFVNCSDSGRSSRSSRLESEWYDTDETSESPSSLKPFGDMSLELGVDRGEELYKRSSLSLGEADTEAPSLLPGDCGFEASTWVSSGSVR